MEENRSEITLKPVGFVRSEASQAPRGFFKPQDTVSEIVVDSSLADALDGVEQFSHLIVLYWMHQVSKEDKMRLKLHPRDIQENPMVGVFATRTQYRPNPIGKTTVRLLGREGNILKVKGLDARDGSPVLDIKPCIPRIDSVRGARVPQWVKNLPEIN
jgi:tRNA-Thr(GGU) m(6)t(6)A37 methyltransferase TsaA